MVVERYQLLDLDGVKGDLARDGKREIWRSWWTRKSQTTKDKISEGPIHHRG